MKSQWYVYIIQTSLGNLYTGITTDPERRFKEHQNDKKSAKGAKFFRTQRPVRVLLLEKYKNRSLATKREIQIKKMSRLKKLELIDESKQLTLPPS